MEAPAPTEAAAVTGEDGAREIGREEVEFEIDNRDGQLLVVRVCRRAGVVHDGNIGPRHVQIALGAKTRRHGLLEHHHAGKLISGSIVWSHRPPAQRVTDTLGQRLMHIHHLRDVHRTRQAGERGASV